MINKYDAAEIADKVAQTFRTLCSHHRVDLTAEEIDYVRDAVSITIIDKIDNAMILDRQLNTQTGEVETGTKTNPRA